MVFTRCLAIELLVLLYEKKYDLLAATILVRDRSLLYDASPL